MAAPILFAAAAGISAFGSIYQGFEEGKRLDRRARYARRAAARRAEKIEEEGRAIESATVAAAGAGNIALESLSVQEVMADNARKVARDAAEARLQGQFEFEAYSGAAQEARLSGILGGAGALLQGGARLS